MLILHDRSVRNLTDIFLESSLFACPRSADKTKRVLRFVLWEKQYRFITVELSVISCGLESGILLPCLLGTCNCRSCHLTFLYHGQYVRVRELSIFRFSASWSLARGRPFLLLQNGVFWPLFIPPPHKCLYECIFVVKSAVLF